MVLGEVGPALGAVDAVGAARRAAGVCRQGVVVALVAAHRATLIP